MQNYLSKPLNQALPHKSTVTLVKSTPKSEWKEIHKIAIDAFNEYEEQAGLFTDDGEYGVI